jgi:cupin 2 domain-containing protein
MHITNLKESFPSSLPEEWFQTLLTTDHMRIERIVSHGHASPPGFWYDQAEGEWILLLQGAARLRVASEVVDLRPGDCLNLPTGTRHRVEWTKEDEPTIWLAVFYSDAAGGSENRSQ